MVGLILCKEINRPFFYILMMMVIILPDINQSSQLLSSIFLGDPDLTEYVYIDNEYQGSC